MLGHAAYILVKYFAYVWWCWVGLRLLAPEHSGLLRRAALLGIARLTLGIFLGLFIFFAALSMNNATRNAPLTYVSIYVPVRILEWVVLHTFVVRMFQRWKSISWVFGGVIVSCLADIPLGIMERGVVPVGRPFC